MLPSRFNLYISWKTIQSIILNLVAEIVRVNKSRDEIFSPKAKGLRVKEIKFILIIYKTVKVLTILIPILKYWHAEALRE